MLQPVYEVKAALSLGYLSPAGTDTIHPLYTNSTYAKEVLLSDDFIRRAARDVKPDTSQQQLDALKNAVKVETVDDTNIMSLSIETGDSHWGQAFLERMIEMFSVKSGEQFKRHQELIKNDLLAISTDLADVEKNIASTKDVLESLSAASGANDLQQIRSLDTLSRFEDQRQALLERKVIRQQELNGIEGLQVIREPDIPVHPVRPRKMLNIAVAGVLGLMAGLFTAFTVDYFRRNPIRQS